MDCGICGAYLRVKNRCQCCREAQLNRPVTRAKCRIKNCAVFQNGKSKFCFGCEKFPCDILRHLDKRYRIKYDMSMIENLENIKKLGIRKFLRNEKIRWTCSKCGGIICVHTKRCTNCGFPSLNREPETSAPANT
jgi:ribosomal protein L37E